MTDILNTSSALMRGLDEAKCNPGDKKIQHLTVIVGVFECYDFLLRNRELMKQMEDIFHHFENLPLDLEDKDDED